MREVKPYFTDSTGTIQIFHGDCRSLLPEIKADVVVTDPPYGMAYVSNRSRFGPSAAITGDESTDLRDDLRALGNAVVPAQAARAFSLLAARAVGVG